MAFRIPQTDRKAGFGWVALALCAGATFALPVSDAAADTTPPRGSVSGVQSPVLAPFALAVNADDDAGLATAALFINGVLHSQVALDPACAVPAPPATGCATQVTGVPLPVDMSSYAPGTYAFGVQITDAAGNAADIFDSQVTVAAPVVYNPVVNLVVGHPPPTNPRTGGGSSDSGSGSICLQPRLSMTLSQRPLRIRKGRPVLRARRSYRFRGRLTCRVDGVRRSAPTRTVVELSARSGKRTFPVKTLRTDRLGRISTRVWIPSTRTLVFRHRSAGGTSQVRIRVIAQKGWR